MPADLDEKPYRDEHDADLLARMNATIKRNKAPKEIGRARLRRAADIMTDDMKQRRARRKAGRQR